ncbi:MAG: lysophospholipid acyltransferase family protein [Phycisphaeraceae bacterium JB051]
MAKPKTKAAMWSQYLAIRAVEMTLCMWPQQSNMRFGAQVGRLFNLLDSKNRRRILYNLGFALPELSEQQRMTMSAQVTENLVKLFMEILHSPRALHPDSWGSLAMIQAPSIAPAVELLNQRKPVIMVTGHFGNWEIMGTMMALMGYDMDAIARPFDNPLIYDWMVGIREKRGLRLITKWDATDRMIEVLDGGGALAFIADQNAGDRGIFVPFFGKLASSYKSIGLLAIQKNVPIVCGYAMRLNDQMRFELGATDIIYPEDWQSQSDPLYYVTARYMRAIESMVRLAPEQYFWMHRRWKSRPRHERLNKPFPSGLRRSLESLPWMTDEQLDSLMQGLPQPSAY